MGRTKVEDRKVFTVDEKLVMLEKSGFRCSCCGTPIGLSDMTVEHVIPISKGGTNDMGNMVALCNTCNRLKDDLVVSPRIYYKFLKPQYIEELEDNQLGYYNSKWLSMHDIMPADIQLLENDVGRQVRKVLSGSARGSNFMYCSNFQISKAYYKDLDEIYHFCLKYNEKYHLDYDVKNVISAYFMRGALYMLRKPNKDLIAVLPLGFVCAVVSSGLPFASKDEEELVCKEVIMLEMGNPICVYSKLDYANIIASASIVLAKNVREQLGVEVLPVSTVIYAPSKVSATVSGLFGIFPHTEPRPYPAGEGFWVKIVHFMERKDANKSVSGDWSFLNKDAYWTSTTNAVLNHFGLTFKEFSDCYDAYLDKFGVKSV